ncbi:hypothetical protein NQ315_008425 [Exocentrus adspersus]|uniref:Chromatin assembly factor 1 subunit A n=1 Tax=Exocentrus adspersus TaxID=1586481 RepID=A0AAV8W588_9CUCU|nr:hypothetical protein NQ315_008425 [Exocentrus adspersus]
MATSGMSYAVHYELSHNSDSVLQDFSRMRIEAHREQPVLYVAMATWIPKCNMYHQNNSPPESQDIKNSPDVTKQDISKPTSPINPLEVTKNDEHTSDLPTNEDKMVTNVAKSPPNPQKVDSKEDTLVDTDKTENDKKAESEVTNNDTSEIEKMEVSEVDNSEITNLSDSIDEISPEKPHSSIPRRSDLTVTPKKFLSPKQLQKKLESEKKRQQRQKEKEEKEKQRQEERERIKLEKLKKKEEKQKEHEQKLKEKEMKEEQKKREKEQKEEQKRKEREEKEQKKKEREEKEEQRRKERELEKLKKQQELEEKHKEKQKEVELKQKTAAAFVNFFVPRKSDGLQEDKKAKTPQSSSVFKPFEVKSDMKLPPDRRKPLSETERNSLEQCIENQDEFASYLKDLKTGKRRGKCAKTWPFVEADDDDVAIVDDGGNLGETISEDKTTLQRFRAKFLKFHENRRPAYYGTWRKKSSLVTPRKPFSTDEDVFNYEEDSDDDWEEEEQGESLNGSDDEADKENDEKDDYEVDNDFFVPHGHLSDDEIDDELSARLSPESLKQKLKLLKDEFDHDMQSKTHKLKPRSIGCIWYNKDGSNVEEAIHRYLQPFAMITNGQIQIKRRSEILTSDSGRKGKVLKDLNPEQIPLFLKVVHGNSNKKSVVIEEFMTYMANNGLSLDVSKATLLRNLKVLATWRKCASGPLKNKFCWLVNEDVMQKYNVKLASLNEAASSSNVESDITK